MRFCIICCFDDGDSQVIDARFVDLREAVSAALNLADLHGDDPGDGHGPPRRFDVCVNGEVELSVAVIRGGLAS